MMRIDFVIESGGRLIVKFETLKEGHNIIYKKVQLS